MTQKIFIVSDATGETARSVVDAAMRQFDISTTTTEIFPRTRTEELMEDIVEHAAEEEALVVHTIIDPKQRETLQKLSAAAGVTDIDLIGPLMGKLASFFHTEALAEPGKFHAVDAEYFRRIEAVEFAVKNDDGQHPRNLTKADIIIVGISRTSKTPLSTYLAQRGHKVANVPIVMGVQPPKELFEVDQRRIFALSIDSASLFRIRQARLQSLGMPADTAYGMRDHIQKEIQYAAQLYASHSDWPVIDVADRAIEETASDLLYLYKKRFRAK
jgi:regulator of PEP synthase PpsR (kinase-PPPase family)